jgi:hypothetical protein
LQLINLIFAAKFETYKNLSYKIIGDMLKINVKIQFIIMAVCLVLFIVLQATVGFGFAFIPLLILIIFAVAYIIFGTIASTSEILNGGDFLKAEKNLALTFRPNWLLKFYRGYYLQLKGFIEIQKKNLEVGEDYLMQARAMGLPTNTDKATVALQLASLSFNKRNFQKASGYIREIKLLDVKEKAILDQVAQMEQAIKAKPSMSQMIAMQGMKGGGRGKGIRTQQQDPNAKVKTNNRKPSSKRKKK